MATSDKSSLDQVDYSIGVHKLLLIVALVGVFIIAFLNFYPLKENVSNFLKSKLAHLPGCQISFGEMQVEFFLPKIVLYDIDLSSSCIGQQSNKSLDLTYLKLNFRGPSFSPFGLAFLIETEMQGQPLSVYFAQGLGTQKINIQEDSINIQKISSIVTLPLKVEGKVKLNMIASLKDNQLTDFQLLVESQNLLFPAQSISSFKIPDIPVKNLLLKAESTAPGKISLQNLVLGDKNSPIRSRITGTILNPSGGETSLDLKGEAAFSADFVNSFPIINLVMQPYSQKDGFYQFRLSGPASSPTPTPI